VTGVRLEQLTKIYPSGVKAVDNLSVAVAPGEFLAILGPSGCGKTTTLRMVAGLETPTSGSIYFGSRRMNDVPPQRRGVGLVFQQHAVFPNMSVYENVAYGLRVRAFPNPNCAAASWSTWSWWGWRISRTACRRSCREASCSGSRWRGLW